MCKLFLLKSVLFYNIKLPISLAMTAFIWYNNSKNIRKG